MRVWSYEVAGDFDLDDTAQLGDAFDVVGTARVSAVEDQLVVNVDPRDRETHGSERRATLRLEVRRA